MILAYDGRPANVHERAGIGNVALHLLQALPEALGDDALYIYFDAPPGPGVVPPMPNVQVRVRPACRGWTQRALAPALREDGPDVFLAPGLQLPAAMPFPAIATAHDLAYRTYPHTFTLRQRWQARAELWRAGRVAAHWVAVSEATRGDLVRLGGISPTRITRIPHGCPPAFAQPAGAAAVHAARRALGLDGPYFLFIGRLQPRKNLARLFAAFSQVADDLPHRLVVAGGPGWRVDEIYRAHAAAAAHDRIQLAGYVDEALLPGLLTGADALALPSEGEGFGLPLVQALGCGTPVLVADSGALPEVAGDAAVVVPPHDVPAMADALHRLAQDEALRERLRTAGRERAARYTWAASAMAHVALARRVAAELGRV